MRDIYLDSVKGLLIFLVVIGHFIEKLIGWDNVSSYPVLATIYAFHMPAFIFISGLLFNKHKWRQNFLFFLVLFLMFQPAYLGLTWLLHGQSFRWNWFERPEWIMWYLFAMIVWIVLTHVVLKLKKNLLILLIAFGMALLIGLISFNGYQYSIMRIFIFWPFFLVGHLYGKSVIAQLPTQKSYQAVLGFLFLGFIFLFVSQIVISQFWLFGSFSYKQLYVDETSGITMRLICFLMSSIGVLAILMLAKLAVPHFARMGRNSLTIYLLHGGFVLIIGEYLIFNQINILVQLALYTTMTCWLLNSDVLDTKIRYSAQSVIAFLKFAITGFKKSH